jgi:hypothetical protein
LLTNALRYADLFVYQQAAVLFGLALLYGLRQWGCFSLLAGHRYFNRRNIPTGVTYPPGWSEHWSPRCKVNAVQAVYHGNKCKPVSWPSLTTTALSQPIGCTK